MKLLKLTFLILLLSGGISQAKTDTIEVYSQAMKKSLKATVVKPSGSEEKDQEFPSVYVLHGAWGGYLDWHRNVRKPNLLQDLADLYQIILITPGVAPFSYYYDSPLMDSVKYETYISKELIPYVDANFPTINDRKSRGIVGLSMGGHGAMMISAKNPDLFIAAGSMSGVMNIDVRTWVGNEATQAERKKSQQEMLGEINYDYPFSEYTAVGLVDQMKENGIELLIDCGIDDFLIETNRQLHQLLLDNGTPHQYIERPGAHTWDYWTDALPFHILFVNQVFEKQKSK
ncbi:alpha/beta hydrolase [Belliella kenyensis]|uniref:Alpha/beta hydrolase n=1 Tax=Belliella kenyensis TaxID=1472724 RepID=A0ABV8EFZ9_9BACT|nr:alpha/beta hydrolase family protein [Belliella kenyensis]MCH7400978.1 esterase family protein [Belliella kenyensis]MDN3603976.1 alpha/beta hydrolase family protein [Belliella kenyensis]